MSIIYEALKKTQDSLANSFAGKKSNPRFLVAVVIFVFVGFLGCGFALMLLINSSSPKNVVKYISPQTQDAEKTTALNLPLLSKSNPAQLVLNGIISMEGEYLALINNQILKEGDYVQDKRIISITKDKVELYSKGKLTVLSQK